MQTFRVEKAYKLFFSRVGSQLVTSLIILFCWVHVFEHVHPFASLLVKSQTKFTIKSRNKQNNKDIEMAGNDWKKEWIVDSSSMMQHGKETEMQKCIIVWSRWTFAASNWRKILVSIKRYYLPWWLFRSACYYYPLVYYLKLPVKILNHFWRKGLTIKFRERKLNLFRIF